MHIYAFGSICRGDVSPTSDVDLLAIVDGYDERFSPDDYSIYSYNRIREIWNEGNPFAWHLAVESKLLFATNQVDYLRSLDKPAHYQNAHKDCQKFLSLFLEAKNSIETSVKTVTFDLSTVFLAVRNFATCFSLGHLDRPDFSRRSAIRIQGHSLSIDQCAFDVLERSRILCTRGIGLSISEKDAAAAMEQFPKIQAWMERLLKETRRYA
jgi:Nucleotidyltransferase domain